jgi:DNA-binding NarL/FixJ family response regulator
VENFKHYTLRAIKLRCWSILDKAIKSKEVQIEPINSIENPGNDKTFHHNHFPHSEVEIQEIHGRELFAYINLFKSHLEKRDKELLNQLIDGMERKDIAKSLDTNINTIDTHIRRLRIRLAEFLGDLGYSYQSIKKFGS